jgi:WD40 repeat protein
MILIACGRQGMAAQELQALLSAHAPQQDGIAPEEKLPDMIWARLYRAFSSYLFRRSDVIDFFHGQLKEAVGKRYLKDEVDRNATHKIIADYFEKRWREPYIRALEELPHQLTKASDWDGTERVLCDLQFVEAKCLAGMLFDIMQDLDRATGRKELISLFRMHKALSLSLPSLSARPELALQTVYNRLVWFDKLPPVLTKAVKNARTHLDTHYSWISAEAPIPGSQFQGTLSIQFDMQSSIQSLSPGSNSVAIASIEGYVEIRDLKYGELIETRKFNHSGITALALREDSTTMIYLDLDGIIQSEQEHKLLEGRRGEELIAYHSSAGVIAVQKNNSLVAYNPHINESTILADDLPVSLKVLRVTPDGQNILFVAGKKPQMRGVAKWTASGWNTVTQSYTGPPIIDADIDPEGRHVMFATQDRQIQIVEIETKSVVGQLFYQQRDEVIIHGKPIKGRFGVDDTKGWIFFATEPGQIACWNWEIDKVCRLEDYRQAVTDPVFLCLFEVMLSSGNLLMTTQSGVKIISKDFYHSNIKKHDAAIGDCVVTASGKVVSVSELDQSVRWFSAHGLNQLHAQSHRVPTSIAPCEESDDVIIGTGQGLVWKQPPDCEIKAKDIFMAFAEPVVSLFSVNSRTVIAAGKSGRVIRVNLSKDKVDVIWHSSGFQAQLKVLPAGRNGLFWSIYREEKADMHTIISLVHDIDKQTVILKDDKILNDIDVSRDGASLCIAAKSVRVLLKTHSGWETAYKRNTPVSHIAFLANGEMIAAVLWEKPWLEIWNVSEGLPTVATIDLPGNSSCISAKGNWIVAGFLSGDIVSMYFHEKG